ncbi:MAG: ankyrin repeat domain-containing protein [Candidatus Didemnitutus sp.]|nr:ankyrin repeat domain-containing protein [Candidatus Didemnitutus sp.]
MLLLIAAGWFLLADQNRSLREDLIGQLTQSEGESPEQRIALVQAAKESIGWDDKTPVPLDQRDPDFTATSELHLAVLYNDRPRVAERLAAGDNPLEASQLVSGMMDAGVSTPVAAALVRGRLILARELLRYSLKPVSSNAQSISNYQLTFEQTCATGNWEAIQVLLDFHPPVWTTEAWEVLFASNDIKILERAVRAGADPNVRNEFQETPLHRAARFNPTPALLNALIRLGADPRARDRDGQTPLDLLEPEVARQVLPPTP